MELGESMMMIFNEMLALPGAVSSSSENSNSALKIMIQQIFNVSDQLSGLVFNVVSSFLISITPLQVFNRLRNYYIHPQCEALFSGNIFSEFFRVSTGSRKTNCVSIVKPTKNIMIIQESYMDALGGRLVYSLHDSSTMQRVILGQINPTTIKIFPSGFTISSDSDGIHGGDKTFLTVAFQIFINDARSMKTAVNTLLAGVLLNMIDPSVQKIKDFLNSHDV